MVNDVKAIGALVKGRAGSPDGRAARVCRVPAVCDAAVAHLTHSPRLIQKQLKQASIVQGLRGELMGTAYTEMQAAVTPIHSAAKYED